MNNISSTPFKVFTADVFGTNENPFVSVFTTSLRFVWTCYISLSLFLQHTSFLLSHSGIIYCYDDSHVVDCAVHFIARPLDFLSKKYFAAAIAIPCVIFVLGVFVLTIFYFARGEDFRCHPFLKLCLRFCGWTCTFSFNDIFSTSIILTSCFLQEQMWMELSCTTDVIYYVVAILSGLNICMLIVVSSHFLPHHLSHSLFCKEPGRLRDTKCCITEALMGMIFVLCSIVRVSQGILPEYRATCDFIPILASVSHLAVLLIISPYPVLVEQSFKTGMSAAIVGISVANFLNNYTYLLSPVSLTLFSCCSFVVGAVLAHVRIRQIQSSMEDVVALMDFDEESCESILSSILSFPFEENEIHLSSFFERSKDQVRQLRLDRIMDDAHEDIKDILHDPMDWVPGMAPPDRLNMLIEMNPGGSNYDETMKKLRDDAEIVNGISLFKLGKKRQTTGSIYSGSGRGRNFKFDSSSSRSLQSGISNSFASVSQQGGSSRNISVRQNYGNFNSAAVNNNTNDQFALQNLNNFDNRFNSSVPEINDMGSAIINPQNSNIVNASQGVGLRNRTQHFSDSSNGRNIISNFGSKARSHAKYVGTSPKKAFMTRMVKHALQRAANLTLNSGFMGNPPAIAIDNQQLLNDQTLPHINSPNNDEHRLPVNSVDEINTSRQLLSDRNQQFNPSSLQNNIQLFNGDDLDHFDDDWHDGDEPMPKCDDDLEDALLNESTKKNHFAFEISKNGYLEPSDNGDDEAFTPNKKEKISSPFKMSPTSEENLHADTKKAYHPNENQTIQGNDKDGEEDETDERELFSFAESADIFFQFITSKPFKSLKSNLWISSDLELIFRPAFSNWNSLSDGKKASIRLAFTCCVVALLAKDSSSAFRGMKPSPSAQRRQAYVLFMLAVASLYYFDDFVSCERALKASLSRSSDFMLNTRCIILSNELSAAIERKNNHHVGRLEANSEQQILYIFNKQADEFKEMALHNMKIFFRTLKVSDSIPCSADPFVSYTSSEMQRCQILSSTLRDALNGIEKVENILEKAKKRFPNEENINKRILDLKTVFMTDEFESGLNTDSDSKNDNEFLDDNDQNSNSTSSSISEDDDAHSNHASVKLRMINSIWSAMRSSAIIPLRIIIGFMTIITVAAFIFSSTVFSWGSNWITSDSFEIALAGSSLTDGTYTVCYLTRKTFGYLLESSVRFEKGEEQIFSSILPYVPAATPDTSVSTVFDSLIDACSNSMADILSYFSSDSSLTPTGCHAVWLRDTSVNMKVVFDTLAGTVTNGAVTDAAGLDWVSPAVSQFSVSGFVQNPLFTAVLPSPSTGNIWVVARVGSMGAFGSPEALLGLEFKPITGDYTFSGIMQAILYGDTASFLMTPLNNFVDLAKRFKGPLLEVLHSPIESEIVHETDPIWMSDPDAKGTIETGTPITLETQILSLNTNWINTATLMFETYNASRVLNSASARNFFDFCTSTRIGQVPAIHSAVQTTILNRENEIIRINTGLMVIIIIAPLISIFALTFFSGRSLQQFMRADGGSISLAIFGVINREEVNQIGDKFLHDSRLLEFSEGANNIKRKSVIGANNDPLGVLSGNTFTHLSNIDVIEENLTSVLLSQNSLAPKQQQQQQQQQFEHKPDVYSSLLIKPHHAARDISFGMDKVLNSSLNESRRSAAGFTPDVTSPYIDPLAHLNNKEDLQKTCVSAPHTPPPPPPPPLVQTTTTDQIEKTSKKQKINIFFHKFYENYLRKLHLRKLYIPVVFFWFAILIGCLVGLLIKLNMFNVNRSYLENMFSALRLSQNVRIGGCYLIESIRTDPTNSDRLASAAWRSFGQEFAVSNLYNTTIDFVENMKSNLNSLLDVKNVDISWDKDVFLDPFISNSTTMAEKLELFQPISMPPAYSPTGTDTQFGFYRVEVLVLKSFIAFVTDYLGTTTVYSGPIKGDDPAWFSGDISFTVYPEKITEITDAVEVLMEDVSEISRHGNMYIQLFGVIILVCGVIVNEVWFVRSLRNEYKKAVLVLRFLKLKHIVKNDVLENVFPHFISKADSFYLKQIATEEPEHEQYRPQPVLSGTNIFNFDQADF